MNRIPDLWGPKISVDVLTPIAILNAQVTLLKQKTQGIVLAELKSSVDDKQIVTILFDLVAPAVGNFRSRVLAVRHKADFVYPALVTSGAFNVDYAAALSLGELKWGAAEDQYSKLARTEDEFLSLLQEALQSGPIMSIVQSMIARSNEARAETADSVEEALSPAADG